MSSRPAERLRGFFRTAGFRLTLWYSGFLVVSCASFFGLAYYLLSSSLAARDREAVLSRFWDLAGEYQDGGVEGLEKASLVRGRRANPRPFFIQYTRPGEAAPDRPVGRPWEEFDLAPLANLPDDKDEHWLALRSLRDDVELELLSLKLADGLLLQVGHTTHDRREVLARFGAVVAWTMVGVALLGLAGGLLLSRRALRPVRDLVATIKRVEGGAVGARVPARRRGDEFDELGRLFNGMLDRIETLIAGMKGALDAVAHDLRTPMTRLRAGAEHALASEADLPRSREALADCVEEADRVVGMITTLMDISEAETGIMRLKKESVDLRALAEEAVELYRDAAEEKGLALECPAGEPVRVHADRNRMRQVLANLLDNAVKYTPAHGSIRLEAAADEGEAVVAVSDTGAGIAAWEIPKVWDRLYRGDSSRSQRGLGLGLSLVKAVVTAHQGKIEVRSSPSKGSRFCFRLALDGGAARDRKVAEL